ncbi:MAG: guanylate kinase [Bacteroidales bacterium]|jgi:guanylate kinase|nr:guanylate kinase [Bacteroidales bacterium]MDN5330034.1 guanylate kinase [Bacteroidales bacterium]
MDGKVIIFSAPSGSGKTTIVHEVMRKVDGLGFSVSATSRAPRPGEVHGRDYYFISREEFKHRAGQGEFVEWEEVYPGTFYGTLRTEIERLWKEGKNVVFDVDVVGGSNLKRIFGEKALAIFIQPPSIEILRQRLEKRGTETPESIEKRLAKAAFELGFAKNFDKIIINDQLDTAVEQAVELVKSFLQDK